MSWEMLAGGSVALFAWSAWSERRSRDVWRRFADRYRLRYVARRRSRMICGRIAGFPIVARTLAPHSGAPEQVSHELEVSPHATSRFAFTPSQWEALRSLQEQSEGSEFALDDGRLVLREDGKVWTDEILDRRVRLLTATAERLLENGPLQVAESAGEREPPRAIRSLVAHAAGA